VKVSLGTIDVPDIMRRAIRHYHGERGLATRTECRAWYITHGESLDADAVIELLNDEPEWNAKSAPNRNPQTES
jgi:hypothetical protein